MIRFLWKGLVRDASRSRLPLLIVAIGVMLTVFMHAYINGFMGDTLEMNARFNNGHLKVMTLAYAEEAEQMPNDLALLGVESLLDQLGTLAPDVAWAPRIRFGGLIDVPGPEGETRAQGPAVGTALDLRSPGSLEAERLNLDKALVRGRLIQESGEAMLSEDFARKLKLDIGQEFTFIGSTMNGSMAFHNFRLAGTLRFGMEALDRGSVLMDLEDARIALDMENGAGEILGFLQEGYYDDDQARQMVSAFNEKYSDPSDPYSPLMKSLSQQGSMGQYVALADQWAVYINLVFVLAMAIVLWNAGLLGALRRYGEFGVRLAIGEEKKHVYLTLIYEALLIGSVGSVIGTGVGLFFAWLLQVYGLDISGMMEGASMLMPSTIRARITPADYYIGFIPGLLSTLLGAMLAGIGIFKRKTSQLFKELEA